MHCIDSKQRQFGFVIRDLASASSGTSGVAGFHVADDTPEAAFELEPRSSNSSVHQVLISFTWPQSWYRWPWDHYDMPVISNLPRCQEVYSWQNQSPLIKPTSFFYPEKYYPGAHFSPIWSFAAFSRCCSFPTWSGQVPDLKHVSMQHFSEAITTPVYLLILPVNDLLSIPFINIAVEFRPPLLGSPKLFSLKCIKAIGTGTVQLLQIYSDFSLPIPRNSIERMS